MKYCKVWSGPIVHILAGHIDGQIFEDYQRQKGVHCILHKWMTFSVYFLHRKSKINQENKSICAVVAQGFIFRVKCLTTVPLLPPSPSPHGHHTTVVSVVHDLLASLTVDLYFAMTCGCRLHCKDSLSPCFERWHPEWKRMELLVLVVTCLLTCHDLGAESKKGRNSTTSCINTFNFPFRFLLFVSA